MGHATLTNLSEAFIRQIYAKGEISIKEVADHCIKHQIYLQASEGEYEDEFMICYGLEEVARFLLDDEDGGPYIEPTNLTPERENIYNQWTQDKTDDWDPGAEDKEFFILDSIKWKFCKGVRKTYPDGIPILRYHSN